MMANVRINPYKASPQAYQAMLTLNEQAESCGLERSLLELVKIRASQINGCAFCLHMHVKDARAHGESEIRLHLLAAWRESSLYTPRERAALQWTEALTRLADNQIPAAAYEELAQHFSDQEQVDLTLMINVINSWNRFAVGFHVQHPEE